MSYSEYEVIDGSKSISDLSRSFFASVYKYMFLALLVSAGVSYYAAASGTTLDLFMDEDGMSILGYVIIFSPLAVVLFIQARINKMSFGALVVLFVLYSVLLGLSLSFIFYIYTLGSIGVTFLVTAGAFGAMALLGYTTKTDLSKMGSLLYMVFIGMFIAGLVNFLIGSDTIDYVISFLGLIVFTGLTAYEMQRMKTIAADPNLQGDVRKKQELMGGLTLYILFINLFMSILRFVGDR